MKSKFCVLLATILITSSGTWVIAQYESISDATEILRRYNEALSWTESVSMKVSLKVKQQGNPEKNPYFERNFIFRRDHERTEWIGKVTSFDHEGNIEGNAYLSKEIMTGDLFLEAHNFIGTPPGRVAISFDYKNHQKALLEAPRIGGPLSGRIFGNSQNSIYDLLSGDAKLHIDDSMEKIDNIPCYVLKATTKYGKVTAWIAPEKGYNALKWSIHKNSEDFFDEIAVSDMKIADTDTKVEDWTAVFHSAELQKVGDVFVTNGGNFTLTINMADGSTRVDSYEYEISDIKLNPDFDALGAFKIDLPDGTKVRIREFPSIKYVWHNGKAVADIDDSFLDGLDSVIERLKSEVKAEPPGVVDRAVEVSRNEFVVTADTQEDATVASPRVPSGFATSSVLVFVLLTLLIIIVISWLVFRKFRRTDHAEL